MRCSHSIAQRIQNRLNEVVLPEKLAAVQTVKKFYANSKILK